MSSAASAKQYVSQTTSLLEVEQRQCSDWREVSKGAVVSFNGDDENSTPDEGRDITKSDGGPSERWKGTKVL